MSGQNENKEEEVTFKVTDRRKFNPDGSVKEGIVFESKPQPESEPRSQPVDEPSDNGVDLDSNIQQADEPLPEASEAHDEDLSESEDPATFINFLSTLATNAAASLGAVPHPATGQRSLDLDTGKYWLDVLAMIREKTKGNLADKEARLLDGLLADLRMQYVTMVRATEEKLKAQAAQKFSGADILGKKV